MGNASGVFKSSIRNYNKYGVRNHTDPNYLNKDKNTEKNKILCYNNRTFAPELDR